MFLFTLFHIRGNQHLFFLICILHFPLFLLIFHRRINEMQVKVNIYPVNINYFAVLRVFVCISFCVIELAQIYLQIQRQYPRRQEHRRTR